MHPAKRKRLWLSQGVFPKLATRSPEAALGGVTYAANMDKRLREQRVGPTYRRALLELQAAWLVAEELQLGDRLASKVAALSRRHSGTNPYPGSCRIHRLGGRSRTR